MALKDTMLLGRKQLDATKTWMSQCQTPTARQHYPLKYCKICSSGQLKKMLDTVESWPRMASQSNRAPYILSLSQYLPVSTAVSYTSKISQLSILGTFRNGYRLSWRVHNFQLRHLRMNSKSTSTVQGTRRTGRIRNELWSMLPAQASSLDRLSWRTVAAFMPESLPK